ncbi:cingulin-like [Hyposmocoma kahamanoa]|uniref:cingulin-like n=1 Tax=Hyposmocoma kahamanoa TaxID=1477025 RepID=UPI000E6D9422|nr:cingulin-like [Hyposmocoma kahamanoa]
MAATAKNQKDKPYQVPRLTPRPTAASTARAARNATNRNLSLTSSQRLSPNRASITSGTKVRNSGRFTPKSDSKQELKSDRPSESDIADDSYPIPAKPEATSYIIDNGGVTIEEAGDGHAHDIYNNVLNQDEIEIVDHGNYGNLSNMHESENDENHTVVITDSASTPTCPSHSQASSRPQTPNSPSSRPQTPRSRPLTPSHPAQRKSVPNSRPNTPMCNPSPQSRPRTPSLQMSSSSRVVTPNLPQPWPLVKEEEDLKSVLISKQRQFSRMKKELDMKQQQVLEVLDSIKSLSERMVSGGFSGKVLQVQDLVVFSVGDWTSEEVAQLCRDAAASSGMEGALEILNNATLFDENVLAELFASVTKIPSRFSDLCLQAFTARQELIDCVKEFAGQMAEDGRGEYLERIANYNGAGLKLCENLRELKIVADDNVDAITQLLKRACRDRNALIAVGESLVREVAHLRQDLEARTVIVNEMREIRAETDTTKALNASRRELEEERLSKHVMKDKLAATESQLRQTRIRVTKMDRQLREAEATITSLTASVKSLEDQSRQREVHLEARARKLKESLKTGEVTSNQIAQQRDALQSEVQNVKEQIQTMTIEHKANVQELNKELKDLKNAIEEQRQNVQKETEQRINVQEKLKEAEKYIEELKAKNSELENCRPNPELPTEREMDLWAELQSTKDALRMTEDEVTACKREKVRFLETLTKISESENKVGMQQKLAAELLSKEEIVNKMQIQLRELTKNIKLNEQKVTQYEQYVRDLQAHHRAVANCQEAPNGISYQDLQQEIMNLRMNLLDTVHRNEELSEILAQKEQQLEQQDKTSRAQARVIKVREELINMLKNKETEQSRELSALQQDLEHRMKIVDEVNKQIASKAEEIQELFATLENKQQQIHRLEKIVLALEEQQRRAQAQRTRHEEKIAALEHELAAGNRRERKFIFF